jgi:hypothetical protein
MLDSETTQRTPARLDCRISAAVLATGARWCELGLSDAADLYRSVSRVHNEVSRRIGAIDPQATRVSREASSNSSRHRGSPRHHTFNEDVDCGRSLIYPPHGALHQREANFSARRRPGPDEGESDVGRRYH